MEMRDKLLAAAARVYAEAGYRGATTRRIANEAGVNEITLFRHFGSKDALLLEAMRSHCTAAGLPALPEEPGEPEEELTAWCLAHHATLYEKRSLIRTAMGEMVEHPDIGRPAAAGPRVAADHLAAYFRRLRDHGFTTVEFHVDCTAWMMLAAIFADAMWRDTMVQQGVWDPPEASLRECARTILRSMGVQVTPRPAARSQPKPPTPSAR